MGGRAGGLAVQVGVGRQLLDLFLVGGEEGGGREGGRERTKVPEAPHFI